MSRGFTFHQGDNTFTDTPDELPKQQAPKDYEPTPLQKQSPPEPKKEITPKYDRMVQAQKRKEKIDQNQEAIQQSKENLNKAKQYQESAAKQNPKYEKKAFASDGENVTMSGFGGPTALKPPQGVKQVPFTQVMKKCDKNGHELAPDIRCDNGVEGRYNASHAEKQMNVLSSKPVGVTKPMCDDCKLYYQKEATQTGQTMVVTDPYKTRIFSPNEPMIEV